MKDADKTKEQLIEELAKLRQQIVEFEAMVAEQKRVEQKQGVKIGEILMEMGCLTRLQLARYLEKQKSEMLSYMRDHRQKPLGEILLEAKIITEEQLHKALTEQQMRLRNRVNDVATRV